MATQVNPNGILTASFQSLSQELASIRTTFDNWIATKKRECIDNKEVYNKTALEQNELLERLKRELDTLATQKTRLQEVLLAENEEEAQLRNENASLNSQINAQQTKLSQAKEIHATLQSKVHSITQTIEKYQQEKVTMIKEVYPRLQKLKDTLGLEIKCSAADRLRIEFRLGQPAQGNIPCIIELDIGQDANWKVVDCTPKLVAADEIVSRINNSRNFAQLCVDLRKGFQFAVNKQNI